MFYDTNVVIDVLSGDPRWASWSTARVVEADESGVVNVIVFAELAAGYASVGELSAAFDALGMTVAHIDAATAYDAGRAFTRWRRDRDAATGLRVLPDFLIGAHALSLSLPLVTRDPRLYRRYFPDLPLITPETHP
jgi:predicted nucleic acid-binding protein